jgi:glutathione synthase/RimK-type ligase-like ATP-grasp enzyme
MRLLVTNTQTPQAYAIVRALRPHASRVVAAFEGTGWRAHLSHAARSRLVDARYAVPSPVEEWSAGRIGMDVTEREQAFVDAVLGICERERIDTIFPSWDPYVYVLSKHRDRFAALGVTIPVPDIATVITALDKYRTVRAGESVGMPCPRTHLYESSEQAFDVGQQLGYPVVIKPRFTSGGKGMAIVGDRMALAEALPSIVANHGAPMLQEYIPGGRRDSVQFVVGRDGAVLFVFHKKRHRTFRRTARFCTVSESASPDQRLAATAALVARVGWWGAMGVETIRDPRDGLDKLMEINPRFPRQLWNRTEMGINEPLLCLQVARGEAVEKVPSYAVGVLFVSPVEDAGLMALQLIDRLVYSCRTVLGGRRPIDASTAPPPLGQQLREFVRTYTAPRRRVWDPYFRYFFQDPLTSGLWWLQFSTWLAGSWRQLGR